MEIFNIDENVIFNTIDSAMHNAEADLTNEQIKNIIERIDQGVPGLIDLLLNDTADYWRDMASDVNGWGEKYASAIKTEVGEKEGSVYVDESMNVKVGNKTFQASVFVRKIEEGVKTWSIKDALLKSEKAKEGKDGIKYITVPFPVSTPRKQSQGKILSKFGGREMSREIHKIVKEGGKVAKGTMLTTKSGRDINISGLTKFETRKYHSQYAIFRRVSSNSSGWQYPNIQAIPVFNSVKEYVDRRIGEIIEKFCQDIVKEFS